MHRYIFLILTFLLATSGAKADIYVTPAQGARLLAAPKDTAETRQLTPVEAADTLEIIPTRYYHTYKEGYMMPVMFDTYHFSRPVTVTPDSLDSTPAADLGPASDWLTDRLQSMKRLAYARQQFVVNQPLLVRYNIANMTAPPADLRVSVKGGQSRIELKELPVEANKAKEDLSLDKENKHWLHTFNASLHFSQAYVSPNWYQGGNNNVNGIAQIYWNVKLNEKYYPNTLFQMTTQYKLGVNSAPDDSLRNYNISDDLFQFNLNFGYKARSNWYYSTNVQFKTQLLNNYTKNTKDLRAAFMSPGELNVGIGMTYSRKTKRLEFDASLNPFSYNLKTCFDNRMNETAFGIKEGHSAVSQYGSNAELNFKARLTWNITYQSRLFLFTNYEYLQGDWQNTLSFNINRFLTTQIFWNLRYDTSTERTPDTDWHRFQFKEILSFGLSYSFATI